MQQSKFYDYQNSNFKNTKLNSSKNIHYVKSSLFEQKLFNEIANYTSSQVSKTISEVIQKYVPVINMYKDEFERNKFTFFEDLNQMWVKCGSDIYVKISEKPLWALQDLNL